MKLTIIEELDITDGKLEMFFSIEKDAEFSFRLSYTCNECAGHGCNKHNHNNDECISGTVYKKINPKELHKWFVGKDLQKIKQAISKLHTDACGAPILPR